MCFFFRLVTNTATPPNKFELSTTIFLFSVSIFQRLGTFIPKLRSIKTVTRGNFFFLPFSHTCRMYKRTFPTNCLLQKQKHEIKKKTNAETRRHWNKTQHIAHDCQRVGISVRRGWPHIHTHPLSRTNTCFTEWDTSSSATKGVVDFQNEIADRVTGTRGTLGVKMWNFSMNCLLFFFWLFLKDRRLYLSNRQRERDRARKKWEGGREGDIIDETTEFVWNLCYLFEKSKLSNLQFTGCLKRFSSVLSLYYETGSSNSLAMP